MALSLLTATAEAGAALDSVVLEPQVEFLPHMIKILMIVYEKKIVISVDHFPFLYSSVDKAHLPQVSAKKKKKKSPFFSYST